MSRAIARAGQASVVLVGALLIWLAFIGLAVDGARLFTARRDLQNVADSAALAGASAIDEAHFRDTAGREVRLDPSSARAAVDRVLQASALPTTTVVDVTVEPDRVVVHIARPVEMTFLRIAGLREERIGASASAAPRPAERDVSRAYGIPRTRLLDQGLATSGRGHCCPWEGPTRMTERLGMKRFLGLFGALALMTGLLVAGAAPAGASPSFQVVWPGHSIQAAIDASGQGGTVVVLHGTYHEHLVITHGVKLIGLGATLAPPSAEQPGDACTGPDPADDGICIAGDFTFDPNTGAVTVNHYVEGVKITGFTITGFAGSGVDQIGGKGSTFVGNVARNNGEYGIAAFSSTGTTELFNTASGSAEAGFYIGDSPQANATLIGNRSSGNLFGFFIRDAEHGTLAVNTRHGQLRRRAVPRRCSGSRRQVFSVVANNLSHNDKACPATEDGPPASGVGVFIFGAHDVSVHGNTILDNQPSGPSLASGGVVVATGLGGTPPQNNRVQGNRIKGNSTDILWDGTGTGNVLKPNACVTSDPAGLCSAH